MEAAAQSRKHVDPALCARLAREHGTPYYLYDAEVIRAQLAKLRAFDVMRYAQKALLEHPHAAADERRGRAGRRGLARRDRARAARRLHGRGRARAASCSRPTCIDRRDARARRRARHPGQRGLGRHARADRPAQARPSRVAAREPGLRARPQPQDQHGRRSGASTASGTRTSTRRCGSSRSTGSIWSACTCTSARAPTSSTCAGCATRWSSRCARSASTCARSRAAAACRSRTAPASAAFDTAALHSLLGRARGARSRRRSATAVSLEIEPGRFLVAEAGVLVASVLAAKRMGGTRFLLGRRGLQRPDAPGHVRQLPRDLDRARATASARAGATEPTVVAGPLCESGDVFTQEEGGVVVPRELPAARGRRPRRCCTTPAPTPRRMASNYNTRAARCPSCCSTAATCA